MRNRPAYEPWAAEVVQEMATAQGLLVLAGAGMGVDSGLPDYRGKNGAWGQLEGEWQGKIQDIMTPAFLEAQPLYCWQRFDRRVAQFNRTQPHVGYTVLRSLIAQFQLDFFVLTTNIDRQFQQAGFPGHKIWEMHGNIFRTQCNRPCGPYIGHYPYTEKPRTSHAELPHCKHCGAILRPNVLLFNDRRFVPKISQIQRGLFQGFMEAHGQGKLMLIELGAGIHIKTLRLRSEYLLKQGKHRLLRINPSYPEVPAGHWGVPLGAAEALGQVAKAAELQPRLYRAG